MPTDTPIAIGRLAVPERILKHPSGYWLCAAQRNVYPRKVELAKWGTDGVVSYLPLQDFPLISLDSAFQGVVNGKFIVGGMGLGGGPIVVSEFNSDTGALLHQSSFGTVESRSGAAAQLFNGGFGGIVFVNPEPENLIRFDVFYRAPSAPPVPGQPPQSAWWTERMDFPSGYGTAALRFHMTAVCWKGLLWVFFARDSAGVIGLIRLRVDGNRLAVEDFNENFIDRNQGDASPSHELPFVSAVPDAAHDRILLAYQTAAGVTSNCPDMPRTSYWTVTEVKEDLSFGSLAVTNFLSPHIEFPRPAVFPRADGACFALHYQNVNADCALGWHVGRLKEGVFETAADLPNGKLMAFSEDGWIIFWDAVSNATELVRLRVPPKLSIRKWGDNVVLAWTDAAESDVLETSVDFGAWEFLHQGLPPVVVPAAKPHEFFRVRVQ